MAGLGSFVKQSSKMMGGHQALMLGMTGLITVHDMKKARQEGKSPLAAGLRSATVQLVPMLMTAGIKSPVRQMFYMGLLSNPLMIPQLSKGLFRAVHQKYMRGVENVMPFSHSESPTEQALIHLQQSMASMGQMRGAGMEAAAASARYLSHRY